MRSQLQAFVAVASIFFAASTAQNITISTCANPSGFRTCNQAVTNQYQTCAIQAGANVDRAAACECVQNAGLIDCILQDCWNVVYGCEYQNIIKTFYTLCGGSASYPFWPAPENAPGGCSCNLGYVIGNVSTALIYIATCTENSTVSTITDTYDACQCCKQATAYTALYDICPGVNPNFLADSTINTLITLGDTTFDQCGSYLSSNNCLSLGYDNFGTSGALPLLTALPTSTGTNSFSVTGTASITKPISPTLTWTWESIARTITAAAAAVNGAGSSSATTRASGSAVNSGSVSSTASGMSGSSSTASTTSRSEGSSLFSSPSYLMLLSASAIVANLCL